MDWNYKLSERILLLPKDLQPKEEEEVTELNWFNQPDNKLSDAYSVKILAEK